MERHGVGGGADLPRRAGPVVPSNLDPMSADVVILVATAVLAAVAVVAATVTVVAARRVARSQAVAPVRAPEPSAPVDETVTWEVETDLPPVPVRAEPVRAEPVSSAALEARVVEGRVVVPPTQEQVVAATLSRPQTRLAVVAQGVAHALRPESRDRIGALVRREYRARRRERLRAGRRAARAAHRADAPTLAADQWLGER